MRRHGRHRRCPRRGDARLPRGLRERRRPRDRGPRRSRRGERRTREFARAPALPRGRGRWTPLPSPRRERFGRSRRGPRSDHLDDGRHLGRCPRRARRDARRPRRAHDRFARRRRRLPRRRRPRLRLRDRERLRRLPPRPRARPQHGLLPRRRRRRRLQHLRLLHLLRGLAVQRGLGPLPDDHGLHAGRPDRPLLESARHLSRPADRREALDRARQPGRRQRAHAQPHRAHRRQLPLRRLRGRRL